MEKPDITRPWEQQYRDDEVETMPWFIPNLDHDVSRSIEMLNLVPGKVLDIGAGPGTQAIALAKLGFAVTGTDISPSAVRKASARAKKEGVSATFICDDILNSRLNDSFALMIDRGCFHAIDNEQRQDYLHSVTRLLDKNGILLLKTFHKQETCEEGPPNRFEADDIRAIFSSGFDVLEARDSVFESTMDCNPKALFCVLKKHHRCRS
ncbi:MAG: class I SAM-dependent methyltransferase [Mariprofundaceae bacterium]|nr:class I SAM-dependent methyltransferase [Mariprofundaceae bacterium]